MSRGPPPTSTRELLERLEILLPPTVPPRPGTDDFSLSFGLDAYREQLYKLLPFEAVDVWLRESDGLGFTRAMHWPPGHPPEQSEAMLERHIDDGTLGLALQQNRPVLCAATPEQPCVELLHALSTREQVLGAFIGRLPHGRGEPDAVTLKLFSILVVQATHALQVRLLNRTIRQHNASLEEEVRRRTREAEQARDQAELASRAKTLFLSSMSHELRTPLTAVIGFAEQIQLQLTEVADPARTLADVRSHSEVIVRSARHLLGLISDILDVSKIESDRLQVERVAFAPVAAVEDVRRTCEVLARQRNIGFAVEYRLPLPRSVDSDPLRFRQILLNLCSNAIKFTHEGGVTVVVGWDAGRGMLECAVSDTGIGIPAEQHARILEPFSQADSSTTRRYGGTGLGLFISRRLAQMLGGDLAFSSTPGAGSCFRFGIDAGAAAGADCIRGPEELAALCAPPAAATVGPWSTRLRGHVLVADDWQDNRNLIGLYLDGLGLQHLAVTDGAQAVEAALEGDFDLVLMDVQMPVMNGEDAVALLRASGFSRPIFALTANVLEEERQRYLAAGFDRVLAKPIEREGLARALGEHLARADDATGHAGDAAQQARLLELQRRFVDGLDARIQSMQAARQAPDIDALAALAHDLKGAGGSFGFPELGDIARELESACRAGQAAAIGNIMERLARKARRIVDER